SLSSFLKSLKRPSYSLAPLTSLSKSSNFFSPWPSRASGSCAGLGAGRKKASVASATCFREHLRMVYLANCAGSPTEGVRFLSSLPDQFPHLTCPGASGQGTFVLGEFGEGGGVANCSEWCRRGWTPRTVRGGLLRTVRGSGGTYYLSLFLSCSFLGSSFSLMSTFGILTE